MTDPIADMLTRIRNGQKARKKYVEVPFSYFKRDIIRLLVERAYLRGYNLHEVMFSELFCHRSKDPCADRLVLVVNKHDCIVIEPDVCAVLPSRWSSCSDNHRPVDAPFLDVGTRDSLLHAYYYYITDAGIASLASSVDMDTHTLLGAGVVCHIQTRVFLNHSLSLPFCPSYYIDEPPSLCPREGASLHDANPISDSALILRVVSCKLCSPSDRLFQKRMLDIGLYKHLDSLIHLVRNDSSLPYFSFTVHSPLKPP